MDGIRSKFVFVQCIIDNWLIKLRTSMPTTHYLDTDSRIQPRGLYVCWNFVDILFTASIIISMLVNGRKTKTQGKFLRFSKFHFKVFIIGKRILDMRRGFYIEFSTYETLYILYANFRYAAAHSSNKNYFDVSICKSAF